MGFTRSSVAAMKRAHERFLAQSEDAATLALNAGASAAKEQVRLEPQFTPRTGNLQKRTSTKVVRTKGGFLMKLSNDAPYAAAIDNGAKPHTISAKHSPFLVFRIGNQWIRKKSVNHPGNRAYRFLSLAHTRAGSITERVLRASLSQIAARF